MIDRLARLEAQTDALRKFLVPAWWHVYDIALRHAPAAQTAHCLACGLERNVDDYALRVDRCSFGGGELSRLECPSCGCVFGALKYLLLPAELVEADYNLLYASYAEADSTESEIKAFHALQPRRNGVYLNWGSGAWSRTIEVLRGEGWDVWGYEPHVQTSSPFVARSMDQISAVFDGVFSNNVLEHLFDPAQQFTVYSSILNKDGKMAHATPCYQWLYPDSRFHVFFPLGDAIHKLAARTGFAVTGASTEGEFDVRVFERVAGGRDHQQHS